MAWKIKSINVVDLDDREGYAVVSLARADDTGNVVEDVSDANATESEDGDELDEAGAMILDCAIGGDIPPESPVYGGSLRNFNLEGSWTANQGIWWRFPEEKGRKRASLAENILTFSGNTFTLSDDVWSKHSASVILAVTKSDGTTTETQVLKRVTTDKALAPEEFKVSGNKVVFRTKDSSDTVNSATVRYWARGNLRQVRSTRTLTNGEIRLIYGAGALTLEGEGNDDVHVTVSASHRAQFIPLDEFLDELGCED